MSRRTWTGAAAAPVLAWIAALIVLAGCGSARPGGGSQPGPAVTAVAPLATSVLSSGGTGWAVLPMGGSSASLNDFWQLFVRPPGAPGWRLATPAGVADNGGLVLASTGAAAAVTGFRPSQDLTFSPLAATADNGAHWAQHALVSPGLADSPGALAAGPDGRLIALTGTGQVQVTAGQAADSAAGQASSTAGWTVLTSKAALARRPAGLACGLTSLTAVAWTAGGAPLAAGRCARPGVAGLFTLRSGRWQDAWPVLPAALAGRVIAVTALATAGTVTTAVLSYRSGAAARIVVAWAGSGSRWTTSAGLAAGRGAVRSVSIWTGGAAGLVLAGGSGAVIAGPGRSWRPLPALPAGTATLAAGPGGLLDALAARGSTLTVWQLAAGRAGWQRLQVSRVPIPYGSSS